MRVAITGSSGVLGSAFAWHFSSADNEVIGIDRVKPSFPAMLGFSFLELDIRKHWLGGRLQGVNILINCAGIVIGDVPDVLDINLRVPAELCLHAISHGVTTIVNVCSMNGIDHRRKEPVYSAAKAGLVHFTKCMAADYPNIAWQALCPGSIRGSTIYPAVKDMPQDKLISAADVVKACVAGLERGEIVVTCGEGW